MQSHIIILTLFILLIEVSIVSTHHEDNNTLIQATPESEIDENGSPACTQSVDIQQRSTSSPDTVSRRTMSGTELIRGSLPVNAPAGMQRLIANAFRNFFVHPDSLRNKRFKRQNFIPFLFPRPKTIKPDFDDFMRPPETSSTSSPSSPITTTLSTTTTTTVMSTSSSTPMTTERSTKYHFNRVNNINVIIEATTMASEETTASVSLSQTNSGALISICTLAIIALTLLTFIL